jgi:prepilin-type N-terminal cleavage/methylation domain-containing protein
MKKNKGFTLIELLIVIAIIGILASIVLVSLGSARDKARIASVKSSVSSVAPIGVICRDNTSASVVSGNSGEVVCDDESVTAAIYPQIPACGVNPADTHFNVVDGDLEEWSITLDTCTSFPQCAGNAFCNGSACSYAGDCV